jgi:hypothetical protein
LFSNNIQSTVLQYDIATPIVVSSASVAVSLASAADIAFNQVRVTNTLFENNAYTLTSNDIAFIFSSLSAGLSVFSASGFLAAPTGPFPSADVIDAVRSVGVQDTTSPASSSVPSSSFLAGTNSTSLNVFRVDACTFRKNSNSLYLFKDDQLIQDGGFGLIDTLLSSSSTCAVLMFASGGVANNTILLSSSQLVSNRQVINYDYIPETGDALSDITEISAAGAGLSIFVRATLATVSNSFSISSSQFHHNSNAMQFLDYNNVGFVYVDRTQYVSVTGAGLSCFFSCEPSPELAYNELIVDSSFFHDSTNLHVINGTIIFQFVYAPTVSSSAGGLAAFLLNYAISRYNKIQLSNCQVSNSVNAFLITVSTSYSVAIDRYGTISGGGSGKKLLFLIPLSFFTFIFSFLIFSCSVSGC